MVKCEQSGFSCYIKLANKLRLCSFFYPLRFTNSFLQLMIFKFWGYKALPGNLIHIWNSYKHKFSDPSGCLAPCPSWYFHLIYWTLHWEAMMENKYSCSAPGVGQMFEENKTKPTIGNICRLLQETRICLRFTWCHCGGSPGPEMGALRSPLWTRGCPRPVKRWDSCTRSHHSPAVASRCWTQPAEIWQNNGNTTFKIKTS